MDTNQAVAINEAGQVWAIEASGLRPLFRSEKSNQIDVDEQGRVVLDEPLRVLNQQGEVLFTLPSENSRVLDLAFSEQGTYIAAGFIDGTVAIWSGRSGRLLARLAAHQGRVVSVGFAPGGALLASGSWDGVVRLWGLGALERSAGDIQREIEESWGLQLEDL